MKILKIVTVMMIWGISLLFSDCSKAQQNLGGALSGKKILIVYLTRTKNTQAIAQIIKKEVGGKLVALELSTPYPSAFQKVD